ncbi:hypothetical protein SALBM135S_01246 [Streptomyces alboniger]
MAWFVEVGWASYGYCLASNHRGRAHELLRLMMERAAALPENRPVVGAIRGQYYEAIGNVDEARRLFEESRAERGPQDAETLQFQFRWARALQSTGQLPAAEEQLRAILDGLRSSGSVSNRLLISWSWPRKPRPQPTSARCPCGRSPSGKPGACALRAAAQKP